MQILLIRHGQSSNNLLYEQNGSWHDHVPDPALTKLGQLQAAQLANFFTSGRLPRPTVLLSSLMLRAVQTATPLAEALDLDIIGRLDLHEVFGVCTGLPTNLQPHPGSPASVLSEVSERLRLPDSVNENGWYDRGIETPGDSVIRAQKVIDEIQEKYGATDTLVAIVCHEWIAQYLLRAAIGLETPQICVSPYQLMAEIELKTPQGCEIPWFKLNNTATILIDFQRNKNGDPFPPTVQWTNRTDHLNSDQIST